MNRFSKQKVYGDSLYTDFNRELIAMSSLLPEDALIAVPKHGIKYFLFSAFLGRRIWNESDSYTQNTQNIYLPIRTFHKRTSFIPEYATETPKVEDYNAAFKIFKEEFKPDTLRYENSEKRYEVYNKCVFDSLSEQEYERTVGKYNWTHILVENKDQDKLNSWVKGLEVIKGEHVSIYACQ